MKARSRRLLLDWHLYIGLLCAPYFVLYGISAIAFNHHVQGEAVASHWERTLAKVPSGANDVARARAARDALGLGGEAPPWNVQRKPNDALEFSVSRPGRAYRVALSPDGTHARVEETNRGWINVVREMHGAVEVTGISWTRLWRWYTEASVVALLFAVISGLLLWWPRRRQRVLGVTPMAGLTTGSLIWVGVWSFLW